MALPSEKLAESLDVLRQIQESESTTVFRSSEISRTHRERLVENGFLMKVVGGWYILSDPAAVGGDTTAWYVSYWRFISEYVRDRLGDEWCLPAEVSLDVQTGNWNVPPQLAVRSPKCCNTSVSLPFGCSIFFLKACRAASVVKESRYGLNVYSIPEALVMSQPAFFQSGSITARTALAAIRDASEVLPHLLDRGRSSRAGRLAGAFRNVQMGSVADEIRATMVRFGYVIREQDPFADKYEFARELSPCATRIRLMWRSMRDAVLAVKPSVPAEIDIEAYMTDVDGLYKLDAYHSLSMDGYMVSEELIERVGSGSWKPDENTSDEEGRAALAARGYWQAFQKVRKSLRAVLGGMNAGWVVEKDHRIWYQELFAPSVMAGGVRAGDVVGYRSAHVYIRNSMHTTLNPEEVRDAMPVLFDLLEGEEDAWVRAVLGHFVFTFIHPYMDGNGLMGRFMMNVMLASGGYGWTVIKQEERGRYMSALHRASVQGDIREFATFLAARE